MEKENNQPKMSRNEKARLQAFKNVMERNKEKSELNKKEKNKKL
ncbi:hypothetical protein [Winogradskyella forsetii]|nr:hypothetical protein [Winogradskyella forsetii]